MKTQQPRGRTTQAAQRRDVFPLLFVYMATVDFSLSLSLYRSLSRSPIVPFKGFQLGKKKDKVSIVRVGGRLDGLSVGVAADDQSLISTAVFVCGSD